MVEQCQTNCQTTGGALFCNGQFVSTHDIDACAAELAQEIDVHVDLEIDADVDVDIVGDCAVANVGGGNGPASLAGSISSLIALVAWLRRRARGKRNSVRETSTPRWKRREV
jgi:site-specific recombinase XerC